MVKVMGSALILAAALGAGLSGRNWYVRRRRVLSELVHALGRMEAELSGSETETEELLKKLGEAGGETGPLFRACAQGIAHLEDRSLSDLWYEELKAADLPLREEELETAARLGHILGRYDGLLQAKLMAGLRQELEGYLALAGEQCGREGKLVLTLSCSAGLLAVLLLN